jgi:Ethylbenzene dehydrogenase
MMTKRTLVNLTLAFFVAGLGLAVVTEGTGIVKNDLSRNIYIPKDLFMPLQVKAAYNGRNMFFRYRWPSERPGIYHDMLKFEGGKWVRYGASVPGPQPQGIYEDRVTMLVDDGSVPLFEKYGGYITIGDRMRFFTDQATKKEVAATPYLGKKKRKTEVGKYLPETRTDVNDWASLVPEDDLAALRKAGYFLDLWHWRAGRSNPIDKSDDQFVAEARYGDSGKGPFFTNWDKKKQQPKLMFDPAKTNRRALKWADLAQRKLGFDDLYYLRQDQAVPFDPSYAWKEGDTIPRRVLRPGEGSRADISVVGKARWKDGFWDVSLVRAMDTGNPLEDKAMVDKGKYTVAMAVHRNATGSRWHYVSLPVSLGLGRDAELQAVRFDGDTPKWEQPWLDLTLYYPGQVSWPMLVNRAKHPGAEHIAERDPVKGHHSETQLAYYGVEMEFNDEIQRQWLYTLLAGLALIAGFGFAINLLIDRKET